MYVRMCVCVRVCVHARVRAYILLPCREDATQNLSASFNGQTFSLQKNGFPTFATTLCVCVYIYIYIYRYVYVVCTH